MFADACTSGDDPDMYQVKVPEPSQFCIPRNRDVEGAPQLDGVPHSGRCGQLIVCADGICDVLRAVHLGAEELEQLLCLIIDASRKLYLLYHLVGTMVKLLLRGDDGEQVDDEGNQQHCYENKDQCAEVTGLPPVVAKGPADLFG